ncbi:MAG: type II secretion system F family protein [Zhaonellaceae bacterium]|jgi:tight adherence protein B|nr:type II secretion system F family protein [Clostridia bacterium]
MFPLLISVLSALLVVCLIILFQQFLLREQLFIAKRLKDYTGKLNDKVEAKTGISWKSLFAFIGNTFAPKKYLSNISKELLQAGLVMKGEEYFTATLCLISGLFGVGLVLTQDIFTALLFGALGVISPKLFLNNLKAKRLKQLNYQIGDALMTIANSLRAGFGFMQAMDLVSKEMPDPIAAEFKRVLREIQLGAPMDYALLAMAARVQSEDLDLVVTAVLIQRQVGGNLAEVLENISETIRERIRIAGEIKTLTAQGKMSGLVIGLLPLFLSIFIFLISRDYILTLFTTRIGLILLVSGVISQVIGFVMINKIVNIEI